MAVQDTSIWSFVNSQNQTQKAHVIGLEAAVFVASLLKPQDLPLWIVKKNDWQKWKPILQCTELFPSQAPPVPTPAIPPKASPVPFHSGGDGFRTLNLTPAGAASIAVAENTRDGSVSNPPAKAERRKNDRVRARLEVTLRTDTTEFVFKTYTQDISVGGILLENALPQVYRQQFCRVEVKSPDGRFTVEFRAELKEVTESNTRLVFAGEQAQSSLEQIAGWVHQYQQIHR